MIKGKNICGEQLRIVPEGAIRFYLCPERKISFDGFVNYEGRRFGVPYSYPSATARVERSGDLLRIYSADLKVLLVTHTVTWSRTDSFCSGQYEPLAHAAHRFFLQKRSRDEKAKAPLQAIKMAYSGAFWRPREGSNLRPRA